MLKISKVNSVENKWKCHMNMLKDVNPCKEMQIKTSVYHVSLISMIHFQTVYGREERGVFGEPYIVGCNKNCYNHFEGCTAIFEKDR